MKNRRLTEQVKFTPQTGPALRVDVEAGIIHRVKVLGRSSSNCHQIEGVTEGTVYDLDAMRRAIPLYEGVSICTNHVDREDPDKERKCDEVFGVLRNVTVDDEGMWADLHYMKSHVMTPLVLEDIQRRLGVYGLSHNAYAGNGRVSGGKFVITEIAEVRSVDLVTKPATNKNLWESREKPKVKTSLKKLIESAKPKLSKPRQAWAVRLLEMDDMTAPMENEVEAPSDPDEALKAGFKAAMLAVLDDDSMDAAGKLKKLKDLLTTHEKLTQKAEPETPEEEEKPNDGEEKKVKESDDEDDKKDVKESKEKSAVAKLAVYELCESMGVKAPGKAMVTALSLMDEGDRKAALVELKASGRSDGKVKSSAPGKSTQESIEYKDSKEFAASIQE